jgi:hypothetical protein
MPFVRGSSMLGMATRGVAFGALAVALMGAGGVAGDAPGWGGGAPPPPTAPDGSPTNIGVNGYLWRATLDTLSFMPLASADPYGGVVITDWYANPEKPNERFKCTVYILDARLRADGLNVAVFKQNRDASGGWVDAPSASQTETEIENAILDRARKLRLSNLKG